MGPQGSELPLSTSAGVIVAVPFSPSCTVMSLVLATGAPSGTTVIVTVAVAVRTGRQDSSPPYSTT